MTHNKNVHFFKGRQSNKKANTMAKRNKHEKPVLGPNETWQKTKIGL
jgi:hypothetical protein